MSWRSFLLRLYPAKWLARYGDEFDALLDDLEMSPRTLADVLVAALRTHLAGEGPRRPRFATGVLKNTSGGAGMLVRRFLVLAVIAAICAAVLFVLHSFAYLLVALVAVILALASGAAKLAEERGPAPR